MKYCFVFCSLVAKGFAMSAESSKAKNCACLFAFGMLLMQGTMS